MDLSYPIVIITTTILVLTVGFYTLQEVNKDFLNCDKFIGKDKWEIYWSNLSCGHTSPCPIGCINNETNGRGLLIW